MKNYEEIAGIIPESELDELLEDKTGAGTPTPSSWTCITAITAITAQLTTGWDCCPTGACTHSCRF